MSGPRLRGSLRSPDLLCESVPAEPVSQGSFEFGYVSEDQVEHWAPEAGGLAVPFERCSPVRRFTSKKGQRHLSGLWWSATTWGSSRGWNATMSWCWTSTQP